MNSELQSVMLMAMIILFVEIGGWVHETGVAFFLGLGFNYDRFGHNDVPSSSSAGIS